ncbi:MAG TPA: hypothetical protein VNU97_10775 [Rhizomicrobium sp.]|jgi:hypothetical protein|nr:hypothetical protein [Rhizomicrobium sp.]
MTQKMWRGLEHKAIAHFKTSTALWVTLAILVLVAGLTYVTIHPLPWHGRGTNLLQILGLAASPILVIRHGLLLYNLTFRGGEAIWLDNANLVYLDTWWVCWFVRIQLDDIATVSRGSVPAGFLQRDTAILRLRNGDTRTIVLFLLAEPHDVVMSRLEALAILQ